MTRFGALFFGLLLVLSTLPAAAQTREKITIGVPPADPGAEALFAYDNGFFEKAGLDVTLLPLNNGAAIAAGVASGAIDVGVSNVISIETAHSRGIPFVVIAPGAMNDHTAPSNVLIVAKDSPLKTAHDLNGQVIGTTPLHSIGDLMISNWMDKNGGDSSTVKYIEVGFPQAEGVVTQGRAAATLSVEPFITQAKGDTRVFADPFAVLGDGFLITAFYSNSTWAQAHPGIVAKLAAVIRQTAIWANANPAKTAVILAKYAKIDVAVLNQSIRSRYAVNLVPSQLQATIDVAAHYKYIDGAFQAQDFIYQPK